MNGKQLWDKLIADGVQPIQNEINLSKPIDVSYNGKIKHIFKLQNVGDHIKVFATKTKFYGRLAN